MDGNSSRGIINSHMLYNAYYGNLLEISTATMGSQNPHGAQRPSNSGCDIQPSSTLSMKFLLKVLLGNNLDNLTACTVLYNAIVNYIRVDHGQYQFNVVRLNSFCLSSR